LLAALRLVATAALFSLISFSASTAWATHPKSPDDLKREIEQLKAELAGQRQKYDKLKTESDAAQRSWQKAEGDLKNARGDIERLTREKSA